MSDFYLAEKNIAEKLIALDNSRNIKEIKTFKTELKKIEKDEEIILSEEQKEAIKAVNDNNVCIITGGPRNRKNNNNKIHNKNVWKINADRAVNYKCDSEGTEHNFKVLTKTVSAVRKSRNKDEIGMALNMCCEKIEEDYENRMNWY